jgi:hypothetical protein
VRWLLVIACLTILFPHSALADAGAAASLEQGQAPNRQDIVQQVSDADPERFRCAHSGRPCQADWIKAVAAALYATDPRWGLNGKRGNPNDLSLDVVTFRIGPTDRHVQAFDICGACGGPDPRVVWNDITGWATIGQPGTAVWVRPDAVSAPPPVSTPPTPKPGEPRPPVQPPSTELSSVLSLLQALDARLNALTALVLAMEPGVAQAASEALNAAGRASEIKTQIENLPAAQPMPCLVGRVPRALGGSSEVTFCPRQ